ncbi:MAG: Membrane-fusion protein-like protein [Streptosporangiaceae bacterium]|nr:Membrane-fusion protein-like protein [Streptosporangiaceae bacterium]
MNSRAFPIRRPPGGPRTALVALGALVIVGGSLMAVGGDVPARISYVSVRQGNVTATVSAAGNVQSAKIREVGFGTSGTVTKVGVMTGQMVKAGRILARLDATQAQEQVNAAVAALAAANDAYAKAGTASASPSACSAGKGSGAAAATQSPRPSGGPSKPTTKPTTKPTAKPTANPTVSVTATPRPTAQPTPAPRPTATPRPTTSAAPAGSGKGGASACGTGGGASQTPQSGGQGGAGGGGVQSAPTTKAQAEAQVVKSQVTLDQARRALAGTVITAPIDGTVLTVAGTVGSQVSGPGASGFVTIGDLNELQVQAKFSQTEVAELKIGQAATITLATRSGQSYDGSVTHIDPAATTTGTLVQYGVMIAFDQVPKGLLLGQTATVQVTVRESDGTLYVPAAAVGPGSNGSATVRVEHGTATSTRAVQIGVRGDQYVEIRSGLVAGDRVLLPH